MNELIRPRESPQNGRMMEQPPDHEPACRQWRREMGVEPTRRRLAPPTGFEARPTHRDRVPSGDERAIVTRPAGFAISGTKTNNSRCQSSHDTKDNLSYMLDTHTTTEEIMHTAKLIRIGNSQAVCLPKAFHFDENNEVRIRRQGQRIILEPITSDSDWSWLDELKGEADPGLEAATMSLRKKNEL